MTPSLADALADEAAALGVVGTPVGGTTEWSQAGVAFACLTGGTAEFRLAPAVAEAARRTPDTAASSRGSDWVAFEPAAVDGHALDRATAWFASAWRRAGEGAGGR